MKILGIGVDIIQNIRIKNSIKNHRFRERIYSKNELDLSVSSKNKIGYFSKRFAAKAWPLQRLCRLLAPR